MKLFNKRREHETVAVCAIADGIVLPLENVNDSVFSAKLLGEGVGFLFQGDTLYAPCDAKVIVIANTKHAIGLQLQNKAELLIHVGLDTVELNGNGFCPLVKLGEKIKKGQELLKIDMDLMREKTIDLTTPIVITNGASYTISLRKNTGQVRQGEVLMQITVPGSEEK